MEKTTKRGSKDQRKNEGTITINKLNESSLEEMTHIREPIREIKAMEIMGKSFWCVNAGTHERTKERTNERMNERTNERTNRRNK